MVELLDAQIKGESLESEDHGNGFYTNWNLVTSEIPFCTVLGSVLNPKHLTKTKNN